jgi:hypothetical protein
MRRKSRAICAFAFAFSGCGDGGQAARDAVVREGQALNQLEASLVAAQAEARDDTAAPLVKLAAEKRVEHLQSELTKQRRRLVAAESEL